jgi:hypothetical protein
MWRITSLGILVGALFLISSPQVRAQSIFPLEIRVVHAHKNNAKVDPRVKDLLVELPLLQKKFSGFELKDSATFKLIEGAAGRMQLPNGKWMNVFSQGETAKKLRIKVEVKELKFSATASIDRGATLAVGGPPYKDGSLILVMTRPKG